MEKKSLLKGIIGSMGPFILAAVLLSVSFQSCQKEELPDLSDQQLPTDPVIHVLKGLVEPIYYPVVFAGPEILIPVKGKMITQNVTLTNSDYVNYHPFFKLVVQNGDELGDNTVMGANIYVNQVLLASLADFRKAPLTMAWDIEVTGESTQIDVEVKGKINGILTIWIEGFLKDGPLPTFTDSRDGNEYEVVTIGTQTWMAANLAYLPSVNHTSESWIDENQAYIWEARYYVYGYEGNDVTAAKATANYPIYGTLYNYTAAQTACPDGWHLPSKAEWETLQNYLIANNYNYDGSNTGDKIAKALAAKTNWNPSSSEGAPGYMPETNNSSRFGAIPGGHKRGYAVGQWADIGTLAYWWTNDIIPDIKDPVFQAPCAYAFQLVNSRESSWIQNNFLSSTLSTAYSIRCIKD